MNDGLKKKTFEKKIKFQKKKAVLKKMDLFCLGSPSDIPNVYHLKQKQIKI